MPLKHKPCIVILGDHGCDKYFEYTGKRDITPQRIRKHLMEAMKTGLKVVNNAVEVSIGNGVKAVLVTTLEGNWMTVTIAKERKVAG